MLECILLVLAASLYWLSFSSENPAGMHAMSFMFGVMAAIVWLFLPRVSRSNRGQQVDK